MIRPRRWDYFLEIATVTAKRSTCPRLAVGAVIVNSDFHIISTGYNGAPRGARHCTEHGCAVDKDEHCTRAVHAEANAIVQAACAGVSTKNAYIFVTHAPCLGCTKLIINAGIKEVIYKDSYRLSDAVVALAADCELSFRPWIPA